jgi:hypothetical protein
MAACSSAVLLVALLTIESSYLQEIERPRSIVPDTVQFWLGAGGSQWRIRTFAIDHDIHVHRIGGRESSASLSVQRAEENIRKSYGDVLDRIEAVCIPDAARTDDVAALLATHNLSGELEVSPSGFAFFNPDREKYKSQSRPK